jgi:hypothetical protein
MEIDLGSSVRLYIGKNESEQLTVPFAIYIRGKRIEDCGYKFGEIVVLHKGAYSEKVEIVIKGDKDILRKIKIIRELKN